MAVLRFHLPYMVASEFRWTITTLSVCHGHWNACMLFASLKLTTNGASWYQLGNFLCLFFFAFVRNYPLASLHPPFEWLLKSVLPHALQTVGREVP